MTTFKIMMLVAGIIGMADTALMLAIAGGINLGTLLPGCSGIVLSLWAIATASSRVDFSFFGKWNYKMALFVMVCAWLASFVLVQGMILAYAVHSVQRPAEWCVILGAGLRGDRPSLTLRRRLSAAEQYLARNTGTKVIVTGGKGQGETITEAEAMRLWLVNRGVSPDRIIMEKKATSTLENLRFSMDILRGAGYELDQPISIVSNDFHLLRVGMLAKRMGMENVLLIKASTPWYLLPNVCIREYFALLKSFVLDRV